jgi:hypothetical protein
MINDISIKNNTRYRVGMRQIHYSKLLVDQAVAFLKDGVCPALSRNQILRFKKRFLNGSYSVK